MDSARYRELDRRHLWHPYTRASALERDNVPLIVRGEGLYLYDAEGRRYVDAISSWWSCALGHGHPRIAEAIARQARELPHSILGNLSHPRAVELAAALAGLMPDDRRHVHFAGDGASAVEAALKIALQHAHNIGRSRRTRFVSLREAYHGDTLAALSLGFLDAFHAPFRPVRFPCRQIPVPPYDGTPEACVDEARAALAEAGDELAAVIAEPMCQAAGGMRTYGAGFLREVYDACRRAGALFIADEIAVGFGRTGRPFAFEHAGIDPDIVCVGKALSAGSLPISAAIVRDEVYETFRDEPVDRTFYHGHTFAGNPIAAAAAVEALRIYREERLPERAAALGRLLEERLRPLAALDRVREVRCLGLIGAVELEPDPKNRPPPYRPQRVQAILRRQGYLVRPLGRVVYLMPPLIISAEELAAAADALAGAVEQAG